MHCKSCEILLKEAIHERLGNQIICKKLEHKTGILEISTDKEIDEKLKSELYNVVKESGYSIKIIEKIK